MYLDTSTKSAVVLGEAHKQYVVTPDIDHLLHELYLNGGATPGDKEMEAKKAAIAVKREEGAVKTEIE